MSGSDLGNYSRWVKNVRNEQEVLDKEQQQKHKELNQPKSQTTLTKSFVNPYTFKKETKSNF